MRIRYGSVCSGVEAASLAWVPLGWEPVFFAEVEPFPCRVLHQRFGASGPLHPLEPEDAASAKDRKEREAWKAAVADMPLMGRVPNLGDMTKINGEEWYGKIDLLVGGTPCQSMSLAGNREGLAGVSGLALKYIDLLRTIQPKWFVWENVPGALSSNKGEDFKRLIREMSECGYSVAWRVLDCQHVRVDGFPGAVPQQRRRLFAVGHLGADWQYPATVLFEPESERRDSEESPRTRKGVARTVTASVGGVSGKEQATTFIRGDNVPLNPLCAVEYGFGQWDMRDIAGTVRANRASEYSTLLCMATGQGSAEILEDISPTLTCNHEAPLCFNWSRSPARDMPVMEDIAPTMMASRCSEPAVVQSVCYENHAQDSRVKVFGDISPTIPAQAGTGGNNLPLIGETIRTADKVVHMVRRLTPLETERLQGFPDNWTRIPVRIYAKPPKADFERFRDLYAQCPDGNWVRYASDSPRYKACGNSMPVNVMRWIGLRIEFVEENPILMKGAEESWLCS